MLSKLCLIYFYYSLFLYYHFFLQYKYQLPYLNGYKECLYFNAYQEYDCVNIYNNGFFVLSLGSYKQVMQNVENNTELTPIYDYSVIQGGLRG